MGDIVNYVTMKKDFHAFKVSMLYFSIIVLVSGLSTGIHEGISDYVIGRLTLNLQSNLFSAIMRMEVGFFDERKTGEITSRLTSDCTKIGDGLKDINTLLGSVVQIVVIVCFMIKLSWKLTLVTLIFLPVIALISAVFGKKYEKVSTSIQDTLAYANAAAEEAISSIRTVRSFAAEAFESDRYRKRLDRTKGLRRKRAFLEFWYGSCVEFADYITFILILYYGA